jgi:hypothetical protein
VNTLKDFLAVLFDAGQSTCFACDPKGTRVSSVAALSTAQQNSNFFCINAIDGTADRSPSQSWHSALVPRRADGNVVCFRSFLIEADEGSLEEQQGYVESIGMPWSACVFSGSKSLHYVVALETPLSSRAAYDHLAKRLHAAVGVGKADPATKNPSRLSRLPGAARADKGGAVQSLLGLRRRVANESLLAWIASRIGADAARPLPTGGYRKVKKGQLLPSAQRFLAGVYSVWTPELFACSCSLYRAGYPLEQALSWVEAIAPDGYLDKHDTEQITNAYRYAERMSAANDTDDAQVCSNE